MTVGGRSVVHDDTFAVRNPATGDVVGYAPECPRAELDRALGAAASAAAGWADDLLARRAGLREGAAALRASVEELAGLLTDEQGKPLADSRMEVEWAAACLDYYADLDPAEAVVRDDETGRVVLARRPMGTVAAITPWNFPVTTAACKLAPAMAAGNAVVLKPSPFTPLTTLRLGTLLGGVFPAGVINVISGSDTLGRHLVADPRVRKVSLTGSTSTGREVAAVRPGRAARRGHGGRGQESESPGPWGSSASCKDSPPQAARPSLHRIGQKPRRPLEQLYAGVAAVHRVALARGHHVCHPAHRRRWLSFRSAGDPGSRRSRRLCGCERARDAQRLYRGLADSYRIWPRCSAL